MGAARFEWSRRSAEPGRRREGRWLLGMGVAAAYRDNPVMKSAARVRLDRRGTVTVETDMTDIGTGSYTVIAQTAAEMMGVPLDKVVVRLGDSAFPVSAGSGGQWGANSATSGVYAACVKLREAVAQKLGFNTADAVFADGAVRSGNRSLPLMDAARGGEVVAEDAIEFGDFSKTFEQMTFGAHFAEVGVDAATGEVRVRRMLAVCSCGRILNPKSARSQIIGAMTMGVGAALMEEHAVDKRHGFFVNHDLASYEVPVHADIPHQDVIFLDETDPMSSPMKAKGVGELGICGAERRWRTRSITRPACACATIRSRSTSSSTACRTWHEVDHAPTLARHDHRGSGAGGPCTRGCERTTETNHGDYAQRIAALAEGTGGVFHRLGADRLAVSGPGAGTGRRRHRHLRARRAHRLAHPSARPDADRHLGLRLGSGGRRHERGGSSR